MKEFNEWCRERHISPETAIMDVNCVTQWQQHIIEKRVKPVYTNQYGGLSQIWQGEQWTPEQIAKFKTMNEEEPRLRFSTEHVRLKA